MEGPTLFNSGFLGAHFNWWIGQIVDDTTWKDNISAANIEGTSNIPGWGRRYKVAIIGLHDQEEETVSSDQLPWAQIMYPVTAGGGQSAAHTSANLSPGNFVFGFFLDGADQQVPVIMGVLGNNAQTKLETKIGSKRYVPRSGFAQPASGVPDQTKKVPDEALSSSGTPNTTIEQPDNPHQQSVRNIKLQEVYDKNIVLINPCDMVGSSLKGTQTILDDLIEKINKKLSAINSYTDAATDTIPDIQTLITNAACLLAKYVKIVFDKIMEYILKQINKSIAPTIQSLPPNKRNLYIAIKEKIIEIITCIFNKIADNLCGQIGNYLNDNLNKEGVSERLRTKKVTDCSSEKLTGALIYTNMTDIDDGIKKILNIVNSFLADIASDLAGIGGEISNIGTSVNGIEGSIMSALSFQNISLNVFGCDLKPKCAVSDFYNLQGGGGGSPQSQLPRLQEVDKNSRNGKKVSSTSQDPFATPLSTDIGTIYSMPSLI